MRHERARYKLDGWNDHGVTTRLADDGSRVLAWWAVGDELHGMLDGKRLEPLPWVRGRRPMWQPHPLSTARTEVIERGGQTFVRTPLLVDAPHGSSKGGVAQGVDWEYGPYDEVKDVLDSERGVVFAARRQRSWYAVCGDYEYGGFQAMTIEGVLDSGEPAFWARRGDRAIAVMGEYEQDMGPRSQIRTYEMHPKSQQVLVAYEFKKGERIMLGDQVLLALAKQDGLRSLRNAFSPDGGRIAFAYDRPSTGGSGCYVDGKTYDGYNYSDGPWWSDCGKQRLAWAHGDGDSELFVDGEFRKLPYPVRWESGSEFCFAPNGDFVIVLFDREHDHTYLMVGEELHGPFDGLETVYKSDNGEHTPTSFHAVLFARKGYAFAYSKRGKRGHHVYWRGRQLGPFEQLSFTVNDDRLVIAHFDDGCVVVEEHT